MGRILPGPRGQVHRSGRLQLKAHALGVKKHYTSSTENKLKIYKTIIKPIWTYGIPLWGTAAMSHINKIEVIQAKILRTIVNGPWNVRNEDIRRDLGMPTAKEEISRYSEKYKLRIATHINRLAAETYKTINMDRRLKRKHPADLIKDIT